MFSGQMKTPLYQIDAFAFRPFSGNPAAVCPLEEWIDEGVMQEIAQENNLPETAFFVAEGDGFAIRWFTPLAEVDLCGHGTLAAAHVIFNILEPGRSEIVFHSRSGGLGVVRDHDLVSMDFPARPAVPCEVPEPLLHGLGRPPREAAASDDYLAVFEDEKEVRELRPDMERLRELDLRGVIATARGDRADFVSRFFAPKYGIPEDPVTGSAHCTLIPYWAGRLGKKDLSARQVSRRGGELFCRDRGSRVTIAGRAFTYMEGIITIP